MKYFSLFTGAGGFEQGMPEDWECIGFSEIDKYANMVLRYHWPDIKNYGDVNAINWSEVPDFDLLVGGSPCQDLSLAGKRKGLSGERSGLFFAFAKALRDKLPKYFIWENVKGALSSNEGWDFAEVLNQFSQLGYELQWQVLNAKDFGVPQNRERIFVIGFRDGCSKEVFYKPKEGRGADVLPAITATYWKGDSAKHYNEHNSGRSLIEITQNQSQGYRVYSTEGLSTTLAGQAGGVGAKTGLYEIFDYRSDEGVRIRKNNQSPSLTSHGDSAGGIPIPMIRIPSATKAGYETAIEGDGLRLSHIGSKTSRGRVGKGQAQALVSGGDAHAGQHGQIRRLTPTECERLMSWQDNWTKYGIDEKGSKVEISDTQRYKMCGNGVVSNVVRELIKNNI